LQVACRRRSALRQSLQRSPQAPDIPTVSESGFPGFNAIVWNGPLAPAGTPKAIVDKINADVQRAVQDPKVAEKLRAVGMEPPPAMPAAAFADFIKEDIARWTGMVDAVGLEKLKEQ